MKKILLTLATVFVLTACGGGAPSPTGDAEKDAKAVFEYMTSEVENCKTLKNLMISKRKSNQFKKNLRTTKKTTQNTRSNSKRLLKMKRLNS